MKKIPNPDEIFPNEYKTSCFIKNVITAPNIIVGDYTYYDDTDNPTDFEKNNVLFNYPEFGDHLIIGKFCQIASGTKFIMGPANHRLCSVTTYPFHVMAASGQKIRRRIWNNFPGKAIQLSEMMCGLDAKVLLCPA